MWVFAIHSLLCLCKDVVDEWEVWNEPFGQGAEDAELLNLLEQKKKGLSKEYIENIMHRLLEFGPSKVVLTGVAFKDDDIGCAVCEKGGENVCKNGEECDWKVDEG